MDTDNDVVEKVNSFQMCLFGMYLCYISGLYSLDLSKVF